MRRMNALHEFIDMLGMNAEEATNWGTLKLIASFVTDNSTHKTEEVILLS